MSARPCSLVSPALPRLAGLSADLLSSHSSVLRPPPLCPQIPVKQLVLPTGHKPPGHPTALMALMGPLTQESWVSPGHVPEGGSSANLPRRTHVSRSWREQDVPLRRRLCPPRPVGAKVAVSQDSSSGSSRARPPRAGLCAPQSPRGVRSAGSPGPAVVREPPCDPGPCLPMALADHQAWTPGRALLGEGPPGRAAWPVNNPLCGATGS